VKSRKGHCIMVSYYITGKNTRDKNKYKQ
jgi:hypothetical protein